jgi:transposase InsO family protein
MEPDLAALTALYERLSYPSALNFRRAAEVAGIPLRLSEAKKFVETYSQRQVTSRANTYQGKITANQLDGRWQADLASYVAQEARVGYTKYTHVLCVLDIFSRFMWTRRLRNASTRAVTTAFVEILESSGRKPIEMNVDKGAEFKSAQFRAMLDTKGIDILRVSEGKNDIATLDRAIATLKLLLTRRTLTTGAGNWAVELKAATESYNNTGHTHLGFEAPGTVEDNDQLQFQLQVQAGKDHDQQDKVARRKNKKITEGASFRVPEISKLAGFAKERSFKPKFQQDIRTLAPEGTTAGRYVTDTTGKQTLKSRIKVVPATSTAITIKRPGGNTQRDPAKIEATIELALEIHANIRDSKNIAMITRELSARDKILMRTHRVTNTKKFLQLHANLFTIDGRIVRRNNAPETSGSSSTGR